MGLQRFPTTKEINIDNSQGINLQTGYHGSNRAKVFPISRLSLEVKDFFLIKATSQRMINNLLEFFLVVYIDRVPQFVE